MKNHFMLLECIRQRPERKTLENIEPRQWKDIVKEANRLEISPYLFHKLKTSGLIDLLPADIHSALLDLYRQNAFYNTNRYFNLSWLADILNQYRIPAIILKGAYLAENVYENIAARTMIDVDILLCKPDIPKAVSILLQHGFRFNHDNIKKQTRIPAIKTRHLVSDSKHIPALYLENSTFCLEIHYSIIEEDIFPIRTKEILQRIKPCTTGGQPAFSLCPEDLLLHICAHAAYNHAFYGLLRALCDISESVSRFSDAIDWRFFVSNAIKYQLGNCVFLPLFFAKALLGVRIPETVFNGLLRETPETDIVNPVFHRMFTDKHVRKKIPTPLYQLFRPLPFSRKIHILKNLFFPKKERIIGKFFLNPNSNRLFYAYMRHHWQILRYWSLTAFKMAAKLNSLQPSIKEKEEEMRLLLFFEQ